MSIALDVGLFFRNSKTKLGLSLSARAVIFTLAFRVGTRSSTWVSPDTLADECGVHRQNIFEPLKKIVASGLVKKKDSPRNKKKKVYSFTDLIKNYHQMSDEKKRQAHEALGDEYAPPVDKSKHKSGKPDSKRGLQSGKPDYKQSGKPDYKPDQKTPQSPATSTLQATDKSPKGTYDNNIKSSYNKSGKPKSYFENDKKHDFAESMNQMASEARHIAKHEKIKRAEMPEHLRSLYKSLANSSHMEN